MDISTIPKGDKFTRFDRETMNLEYYYLHNYINKLKYFALLVLCLLSSIVAVGQITMGSSMAPRDGSLLDLKQNNNVGANSTKGLLLPRVVLTDEGVMLSTGQNDVVAHTGLMVYNIGDENCAFSPMKSGVYIWTGDKWVLLNNKQSSNGEGVQALIKSGTEDVTNGELTVNQNEQLSLTASAEGAKTFSWYLEGTAAAIHQGATLTKTLSNPADFGKYTVVMTDGPECGNEIRAFVDVKEGAPCIADVFFDRAELKNQNNAPMSISVPLGGYDITGVTSISVTPVMAVGSQHDDYFEIRKGSVTGTLVASGTRTSLVMTGITAASVGNYYLLVRDICGVIRTDSYLDFTLVECSATVLIDRVELRNQSNVLIPGSVLNEFEIGGATSIKVTPIMGASSEHDDYFEIRKGSVTGTLVASGTRTSLVMTGITAASVGDYYLFARDKCGVMRPQTFERFTLIECSATVAFSGVQLRNQSNTLIPSSGLNEYEITGVTSIKVTPVMTASSEHDDYFEVRKGSVTGAAVASGTSTSLVMSGITVSSVGDYYVLVRDRCGVVRTDVYEAFTLVKRCDTNLKIERLVVTDQNKSYLQYVEGTTNFEAFSGVSSIIVTPIAKAGTDVAVRYYLRKGSATATNNLAEGTKTLTTSDIPIVEGTTITYYVVPVDKCGAERPDLAYSFTVERKVCVTPGMGNSGPITQQNLANFRDPSRFTIWDSAAPNAQPAKIVGGAYIIPYNSFRIDTAAPAVPTTNAHRFEIHKDDGTILNPNNGKYLGASNRWEYYNISDGPSINGTYTMYMYDTCGNIMAQVTIKLQKQ